MKVIIYGNELYHHGILGQRWGDRNGPPYPLGSGDHSAREVKKNWRKSLKRSNSTSNRIAKKIIAKQVEDTTYKSKKKSIKDKWNSLSDKQKKAIKIGAAIAVTALASYGVYQLVKNSNGSIEFIDPGSNAKDTVKDLVIKQSRGQNFLARLMPKELLSEAIDYLDDASYTNQQQIFSLDELEEWQSGENTVDNCMKIINPGLSELLDGKDFQSMSYDEQVGILASAPADRTMNCLFCSTAYELNRRGIKCQANGRLSAGPITQIADMFKIVDKNAIMDFTFKKTTINSIVDAFQSNYPDGARGNIVVSWKSGGAHSMAWEIINNNFTIIDAQSGMKYAGTSELNNLFARTIGDITSVRTDNAELIEDSYALLNALDYPLEDYA